MAQKISREFIENLPIRSDGFLIPRTAAYAIARPRLIARLDRLATVTVIEAPAGYGKTALLGGWALRQEAAGATVIWVSGSGEGGLAGLVSREIESAVRFSAEKSGRGYSASGSRVARAAPGSGRTVAASTSDGSPRVIVVFDHAVTEDRPTVAEQVCALSCAVDDVHFVVTSRLSHPIARVAVNLGLDVDIISRRELELTPNELIDLAKHWGHELALDRAHELCTAAGGWPSVAKSILDNSSPLDPTFRVGAARQFLEDSVTDLAGGEILLRLAQYLSLTDAVTGRMAEVVMSLAVQEKEQEQEEEKVEQLSAEVALRQLDDAGFLRRVESPSILDNYVFPSLLGNMLASGFEAGSPAEAARAHVAYSRYYLNQDDPSTVGQALVHAHKSCDLQLLSDIYIRYGSYLTIDFPAESRVAYSDIADRELEEFPMLAIPRSIMRALSGSPRDSVRSLMLTAYVQAGEWPISKIEAGGSVDYVAARIVGGLIARRSSGRIASALRHATRFDAHLAERSARGQSKPVPVQLVSFILHWSTTLILAGDLPRAIDLSSRVVDASSERSTEHLAATAVAQLILLHTLRGDPLQAELWRLRFDRFVSNEHWVDLSIVLPTEIASILDSVAQLDQTAAEAALVRAGDPLQGHEYWAYIAFAATQHALVFGEPIVMLAKLAELAELHPEILREIYSSRRILERCSAELMLALGELNQAQRLLESVDSAETWTCVPRARLQLIAGNFMEANAIAAAGLWHADTSFFDRIDLQMITAQVELALDDKEAAAESFVRGHDLSVSANTLLPYGLIPPLVFAELLEISGVNLSYDHRRLIAGIRSIYPQHGVLVEVSPREKVVLAELAIESSLAGIAKSLGVSVNTVKKQTVSLYAKLGVKERSSAVARGRWLGLID